MVIKGFRIPSSQGAKGLCEHVFRGGGNERIEILRGTERDVFDMVRDARAWRRKFGFRHFVVAPREVPTREQFAEAVDALAAEFGFPAEAAVVVGHVYPRQDGESSPFHLHVFAPEVDPATGRVLSSRWSYARHEKVARMLEARWEHAVVPGRFNGPVLRALDSEGRDEADYLRAEGLAAQPPRESAYPSGLHQEVRRRTGRRMPQVAQEVGDARTLACGSPAAFLRILGEAGLRVAPGDKPGRWVIEARGPDGSWAFAGALHRLAGMKAAEVDGCGESAPLRCMGEGWMGDARTDRRWGPGDYSEILAGMADPGLLRTPDARGLTPGLAATFDAGEKTSLLMALLDMAAEHEGESALDRIERLLSEMVERQKVTNERLNALVTLFSSRASREEAWERARAQADEVVPPRKARAGRKDGTGGAPAASGN